MVKWILVIVVFLAVAVGGAAAVLSGGGGGDEGGGGLSLSFGKHEPEGKIVTIAEAQVGELTRTVSAPGGIEPRAAVEISAQVSARIVALPFDEGDAVKKDDVVVRLDSRDIEAQLDSARAGLKSSEAELDGAKASLIRANAEYERATSLIETGDISQADMDLAEADYLQSRSRLSMAEQSIEIAKAQIKQREKDLDNAIIRAPIDGVITVLNAEVGETVVVGTLNNPGSVIMEIADLSQMVLKAQVDEINIAPVKPGQRATVYINAYDDRTYEGTVERVGLKRQVGSDGVGFFEVEILVETSEGDSLYSGLSANTEIDVETFSDVLIVPSQAVLERRVDELPREIRTGSPHVDQEKTWARVVYVVGEDMKTEARPVSVGPSDLSETVVLGGLEAGEKIVVGPYRELVNLKHAELVRDEAQVAAEKEAREAAKAAKKAEQDAEKVAAENGETEDGAEEATGEEATAGDGGGTAGEQTETEDAGADGAGS